MLDEIISVVPFRDKYLIIYRSGKVLEMVVGVDSSNTPDAMFRKLPFEIPRVV